jgi:hypothetical protein
VDSKAHLWTPDDYRAVALKAVPLVDEGRTVRVAFLEAQKEVLPAIKHRVSRDIGGKSLVGMERFLEEARALLKPRASDRMAKARAVQAAQGRKTEAEGRKPMVYWTMLEKARVAREMKNTEGLDFKLSKRVVLAMEAVLPPDRWLSRGSISGACGKSGSMKRQMEEGAANEWILKKEEAAVAAPTPVDASNEVGAMLARAGEAPDPAPAAPGSLAEASRAFADTMQAAVGALMRATALHTMQTLDAKLDGLVNTITERLHNDLRATVMSTMEAELGGPVRPPLEPKAPTEAPAAKVEVTAGFSRLKVDVLGLPDNEAAAVKRAFNGNTDLRIMTTEHAHHWLPRTDCTVIQNTRIMSHKVSDRLKKHGIKPIRVTGGPSVVIAAIEALHQSAGIAAH